MSKYGDRLVNRQNISRSLDMEALNVRNTIESKRREVELNAELATDLNQKARLFMEALECHKQFSNTVIEKGLLGKLLVERPLGNIQLLEKVVRSMIAAQWKDKAQAVFDQYFLDYPQDKDLTKVASISKVIERGTVKLIEQQDFVPPDPLPVGWQYAKERNERVLRLDHKMYETNKSAHYDLDVLKEMIEQDLPAAILYVKKWIVKDERVKRKDPLDNELWLYSEACKIARKKKNLLEECLFQQRLTNLLRERHKSYGINLIKLRKIAAKLAKQENT